MENNNTPRKARIFYKGESIPVLVEAEEEPGFYSLLLDWNDPELNKAGAMLQEHVRNLYMEAIWGYEGAGEDFRNADTGLEAYYLHKDNPFVTLVYGDREPDEAQDSSVDTTGIDDVPPPIDSHAELKQHLNLLARSGYKVKSFDLNIQESGEAHLCATFTKEVDN